MNITNLIAILLALGGSDTSSQVITTNKTQTVLVKSGSCGPNAKKVSTQLLKLGFLGPRKNSSRCIDSANSAGIIAFQKYKNITVDGVAGPQTRAKLFATNKINLANIPGFKKRKGNYIFVSLARQITVLVNKEQKPKIVSISSGKPGFSTPTGVFSIYRKEKMSWSVPYSVWMPWASYFVGGIAFHESADVPAYPASHGCIRVPKPFSRYVWGNAPIGRAVVVA